jgi:hypothetical protein
MHILVFAIIQALVCIYVFFRGGSPERITASLLLVATGLTYAVPFDPAQGWLYVRLPILVVDMALLVGLCAVAARANRFWPIWLSALHLVAIAVHGVRALDPSLIPWIYGVAIGKIAYPMLLILLVGSARHHRRKRRHGRYADWSAARFE